MPPVVVTLFVLAAFGWLVSMTVCAIFYSSGRIITPAVFLILWLLVVPPLEAAAWMFGDFDFVVQLMSIAFLAIPFSVALGAIVHGTNRAIRAKASGDQSGAVE